jgi:peptide/nickel transport system permease protein
VCKDFSNKKMRDGVGSMKRVKDPKWRLLRGVLKFVGEQIHIIRGDRFSLIGGVIFFIFLLIAVFASVLAPYDPTEIVKKADGSAAYLEPPSKKHWLGTTSMGRDVLSQVIFGIRKALLMGILAALSVTIIGTTAALFAGYYKGIVDEVIMRIADIVLSIPFIPFVIVLVSILGRGDLNIILAISLFLWREPARVVRAQALSLSERPFVKAAKVAGASDLRIMYLHIAPNLIPLCFLYAAFGIGWAVTAESSVSFLGFGDPTFISLGGILHTAFLSGAFRKAWWWAAAPGICLSLLILSAFLISHGYEVVVNPRLREN